MRSSGVIKVLYVVRKASQYKTRSAEQKTEGKKQHISVEVQPKFPINLTKIERASSNVEAANLDRHITETEAVSNAPQTRRLAK